MPLYKKVAVFGATSGIGRDLAKRFVEDGSAVIAIGRRQENLAELEQIHGHDKVYAYPFDITKLESIPDMVEDLTSTHPDIDAVLFNSGIQRTIDFTKPDKVDLGQVQLEMTTNYLAQVALTQAFLLFALKQSHKVFFIYVTSGLALVPMPRCPNYCASKAALHSFILTLREQLRDSNVEVVELYPPAVQTELHDKKHQPEIKDGHKIGIPLDEFTTEAWAGLSAGKDQIPVGGVKQSFDGFERERQKMFRAGLQKMP